MRLPLATLLLVLGCVGDSWSQSQRGYGYLPPDIPFTPDNNNIVTASTLITRPPSTFPTTRPPITRPPVTRPPVTRPPITRPPVTRPPVTRPPVTRPPVTRPPITRPPVTRPPITRPPSTPTRPPPPTPSQPTRPPVVPTQTTPHDDHHHHHHHHSDDPLQWLRDSVPGEPGEDYPIFGWPIPETGFTCSDKVQGFYADLETRCQVFHVCNPDGFGGMLGIKFLCPNGTIFNQEHFTCEWWNQVSCGQSESFYSLNNEIGVVPDSANRPRPTPGTASFNVPVSVPSPNRIPQPRPQVNQPQLSRPRPQQPRPAPAPVQPSSPSLPRPFQPAQPQTPFSQNPAPAPFQPARPRQPAGPRQPARPRQPAPTTYRPQAAQPAGYPAAQPDPPNALYTTPQWGNRQN